MQATLPITDQTSLSKWFEETVAGLRTHQFMLETDTAPDNLKSFYDIMMTGSSHQIAAQSKLMAQKHFVTSILVDYLTELANDLPQRLAVNFNDSEVLVWSEIKDDDVEMERKLLVAEAKVNAKYHDFGFDMETTIVENSDNLSVPNHYQSLK